MESSVCSPFIKLPCAEVRRAVPSTNARAYRCRNAEGRRAFPSIGAIVSITVPGPHLKAEVGRAFPAMGTLVHIGAQGSSLKAVERSVETAQATIHRVERLMSFHSDDSEVTMLNREAGAGALEVEPWTYSVLRRALFFAKLSDGLFDISLARVLVNAGLLPDKGAPRHDAGDWRDIVLLPGNRVAFRRPVLVDLGGIAKGFAIDLAVHALYRGGCATATVNAGGDLRRFGSSHAVIQVRTASAAVPLAELRCGAIATSAQNVPHLGRMAQPTGQIADPRTRRLWGGTGRVSVAASTCVVADALTKVAALAGPSCRPILARFGAQAVWDPLD